MKTADMQRAFREGGPLSRMTASIYLLYDLDQHLPWLAARQFDGINLTSRSDGWLLVVKARRKDRPQVAFFDGDNPEECFTNMAHQLLFDLAQWKDDKFRSMRSDKT